MRKGCIFLISARKYLIEECLRKLDQNYNKKYNYPILIFYHGNLYENKRFRNNIKNINQNTEYRFHKIDAKIPLNIQKSDLFWNLDNPYARKFKGRIGYLHANHFWNNFMNFNELKEFDYLMRIDDDSWFKEDLDLDFFEEIDKRDGLFGTGFTWNSFNENHLNTRVNLFKWIKYYVSKYEVIIKDEQLKKSLDLEENNELFHTLKWSCGNLNVYNRKMFDCNEWKDYLNEFNKVGGGYRYRWGDIEVIGLYAYMYLDNPLIDFDLIQKGLYKDKLPRAKTIKKFLSRFR